MSSHRNFSGADPGQIIGGNRTSAILETMGGSSRRGRCRKAAMLLAVSLFTNSVLAQEDTKPVVSAEPTSFEQVTRQLDRGGSLYVYLNTTQWLERLADRIKGWREAIESLPGTNHPDLPITFDLITRLIRASGIESVNGVGMSGIAIEKGLYQTKIVVGRARNSPGQGIWEVFGQAPHELSELDWLPASTAMASISDFEAASAWGVFQKEVDGAKAEKIKRALRRMGERVRKATGQSLDSLINSMDGRFGILLTLKEENQIKVPVRNGSIEIPEPGLVMALKVKDDSLFQALGQMMQRNPQTKSRTDGDMEMRMLAIPVPLPMTVRLTVAQQGEWLLIASNDELITQMGAVHAGDAPSLKGTAEFKRLAAGLPLEGNSVTFVSERLGKTIQTIQKAILEKSVPGPDGARKPLLEKIYALSPPASVLGVSRGTADAWVTVSHGTQQPADALVLPVVVAPVAIVAGMTFPALAKAKSRAQKVMCMNNLKQLGLAALIYASDHNGELPKDIASMKRELATPRVLVCPSDPKAKPAQGASWETFDLSSTSYEYVNPGLKETTPDMPSKVLFRCPIHQIQCFGDGSVH